MRSQTLRAKSWRPEHDAVHVEPETYFELMLRAPEAVHHKEALIERRGAVIIPAIADQRVLGTWSEDMALFDTLSGNYPTMNKDELFDKLGGGWPALKNNPNYNNTCAIRLSVALNSSGYKIPITYGEGISGAGDNITFKVATMRDYINATFGEIFWGISKNPGTPFKPEDVPNKRGIIVYHAKWTNATGHFDLWNKPSFVGAGNFNDVQDGYDIALWDLSQF